MSSIFLKPAAESPVSITVVVQKKPQLINTVQVNYAGQKSEGKGRGKEGKGEKEEVGWGEAGVDDAAGGRCGDWGMLSLMQSAGVVPPLTTCPST